MVRYGRVTRTDKVSVLEVVAIQLVEGVLRIRGVPEHDVGSALGIYGDPLSDLARHVVSDNGRGSSVDEMQYWRWKHTERSSPCQDRRACRGRCHRRRS